jgi:glucan phosphoethanolaminetransferase (alkaline phosphatase superfamily)
LKFANRLLAPRWALPILAIAAVDLSIRWRQALAWNRWEVLFYALSIVLALAWIRVVAGILPDRRRHPRIYWTALAVLGAVSGFILLVHFDYYFYFGIHPEVIALGHVVGETAEAARIVLDEFSPIHIAAFVLLIVVGATAWRVSTDPRPGRIGLWSAAVLAVVLTPAFNLNVAMSPGNFLPSVNLVFTASKAIQYAAQGKGAFRRLQVSSRIPVPPQPGKSPYNVLILVNESLRAGETGYNGYTRETTPNVDAFLRAHSSRAFNFSRCFTNSTKTSESVPSILTGVHPMEDYLKLHRFPLLYEYAKAFPGTVSFLYSAHGYNVANFRFFLRTPRLDKMIYQENAGHPRFNSLGMDDKHLVPPFESTIAELPAQAAFAGVLHLNGPHFPYRVPGEDLKWGSATRQDDYDNSIRYQDKTIGAILRVLQERGRLDDTIVFSTSDHGEAFGEHGPSGHRHTFYEEIIHVPCWMHLPEKLARQYGAILRANVNVNVTNLDWVPTMVDLLGLDRTPEVAALMKEVHGQSLVRPMDPERPILVQNGTNGQRLSDGFALVQGPWRLLDHPRGVEVRIELYNLAKDRGQENNLWTNAPPDVRAHWRKSIAQFPVLSRRASGMLAQDGRDPARAKP